MDCSSMSIFVRIYLSFINAVRHSSYHISLTFLKGFSFRASIRFTFRLTSFLCIYVCTCICTFAHIHICVCVCVCIIYTSDQPCYMIFIFHVSLSLSSIGGTWFITSGLDSRGSHRLAEGRSSGEAMDVGSRRK